MKYGLLGEWSGWRRCPVTGRDVPTIPSLGMLTRAQASAFIEWLIPFALQKFGVSIPYPDKRFWEMKS